MNAKPPEDIQNAADLNGRTRLLFDLTHLAIETDSTRLITTPPIPGVSLGHHDLSHHGKDPPKLDWWERAGRPSRLLPRPRVF